ncbi:DUF4421 family protein [Chryseobacterium sp.]|uniref:DUF4421 family protein n=1 Tax=Chryseobacterium sp. TaxID=1871047 RepID=UPI0025BE1D26|nr:DUF4421 family protein [Chryseobacterium sp.]
MYSVIVSAQKKDSLSYKASYSKDMMISLYSSNNNLFLKNNNVQFSPNNSLNFGAGVSLKNTVLNFNYAYGFLPLKSKNIYGKSTITDLQIHHYGEKLVVDFLWQKYKGFYNEEKKDIKVYPDLAVTQLGGEISYVFNRHFSSKAAFELSEKQMISSGSFILGGGVYYHSLKNIPEFSEQNVFHNFQMGANGGYAYSWVINDHWLMTGMATLGANFGNTTDLLKDFKIKIYPTAFARGAVSYHKENWAASFGFLLHNKVVYTMNNDPLSLYNLNMQIIYVRQIDNLFKKKKKFYQE